MEYNKFTTGKVRLSYQNIWETKIENGKDTEKYTICIMFPKDDTKTLELFEKGIKEQMDNLKAKNGGKLPAGAKNPLRDGDLKGGSFAGNWYVNASTKFQPTIVDRNKKTLTDSSSVVSGDYIRLFMNLYNFNVPGNAGVGVGFGNIQFLEKGEYLGGSGASFDDEYSEGDNDGFDDDLPI